MNTKHLPAIIIMISYVLLVSSTDENPENFRCCVLNFRFSVSFFGGRGRGGEGRRGRVLDTHWPAPEHQAGPSS